MVSSMFKQGARGYKPPPVCKSKKQPPPPVEACPQFFLGPSTWQVSYSGWLGGCHFSYTMNFDVPSVGPTLSFFAQKQSYETCFGTPVLLNTAFEWELNPTDCTWQAMASSQMVIYGYYAVADWMGGYGGGPVLNFTGSHGATVGGPGSFDLSGHG